MAGSVVVETDHVKGGSRTPEQTPPAPMIAAQGRGQGRLKIAHISICNGRLYKEANMAARRKEIEPEIAELRRQGARPYPA